jgi:hypothetical protein
MSVSNPRDYACSFDSVISGKILFGVSCCGNFIYIPHFSRHFCVNLMWSQIANLEVRGSRLEAFSGKYSKIFPDLLD